MAKATSEEIDLLARNFPKFVEETRNSFSDLNRSLNVFEEKLEDIYKYLGKNADEVHVLAENVNEATKNIEKQTKEIVASNQELQQEVAGSTKVVIKEVEKSEKKWYQIWKKNKEVK